MFAWLANAFNSAAGVVDDTIRGWVHNLVNGLYSFLHTIFGLVGRAWGDMVKDARDLSQGISDLGTAIYNTFHRIIKIWIPTFTRWVTKHILDPLLNVLRWIDNKGSVMWHYFTNPGKLVDLIYEYIIAKLEATAWATAEKLGEFFISLFAHHMKKFLTLIEDIIHAAL